MYSIQATVDTELAELWFVADMADLQQHQILAVVGVRAMPVDGHNVAHASVIERKRAEMLGDENDGEALAVSEQKARDGMILPEETSVADPDGTDSGKR